VFIVKETGVPVGGASLRAHVPHAETAAPTAASGVFHARWSRRADLMEADPAARRIFGIGQDADPGRTGLFSLFPDHGEGLYRLLSSQGAALRLPQRLEPPGFPPIDTVVSAFVARDSDGNGVRIDGIIEDATDTLRTDRARAELLAALQADSQHLQAAVSTLASVPLTCQAGDSIREAARLMARGSRGEILVKDSSGATLGILTSRDLAERVVAAGIDVTTPVGGVMTAPLRGIPSEAPVSDAVHAMRSRGPGRLVLRDATGEVTGMLRRSDLLDSVADSPRSVLDSIPGAHGIQELGDIWATFKEGLRASRAGGLRVERMSGILAQGHDQVVGRLTDIALAEMGESPCPFVFLALGSAGRREMLPESDQDNALVFLPRNGTGASELPFFLEFGERLCRGLDRVGVPLCKGGTSALSEKCCATLEGWESRFSSWIGEPEPEKLLDIHVFFDFRPVVGDSGMADSLRLSVFRMLRSEPAFFLHLANGVRNFRLPPLPLRGGADAKEGSSLISGIVRAYALKHGISATNTFDRIRALTGKGILSSETARESAEAFDFFLQTRLTMSDTMGSFVDGGGQGRRQEALARVALAQTVLLQKRIGFDFLGSAT